MKRSMKQRANQRRRQQRNFSYQVLLNNSKDTVVLSSGQFEEVLKTLPSYQKQVFIHGERLLIIENGQYKIAAIQLAWELWQGQQIKIDEIDNMYLSLISECELWGFHSDPAERARELLEQTLRGES